MMKKQVLFIQGGGQGAHEADGELVASLQAALGAEYTEVILGKVTLNITIHKKEQP